MPSEMDEISRKIMQLEVEKKALKHEKDELSKNRVNEIDKKLENEMGLAYSIVKLGRSARNASNMKNRQPLS